MAHRSTVRSFPTTIHFGPGARKLVAEHLKAQGITRPLIVTDRGIAPLPLLAAVRRRRSPGLDVAVYSGIWGNPVRSQVERRRRRVQGAPRRRGDRPRRRRGARRREGHRADGDAPGRHPRVRVGPSAGAADRPARCPTSSRCRRPPAPARRSAARRRLRRRRRTSRRSSSRRSCSRSACSPIPS